MPCYASLLNRKTMEDPAAGGRKEEPEFPVFTNKINYEAKLKELLRNITSVESELCSEASKEFRKILKSDSGAEFLRLYIKTSPQFNELLQQAWNNQKAKPGFAHLLNLISGILCHLSGKDNVSGDGDGINIVRRLDGFSRKIVEEKMGDLYKELNSKEAKRQNAVLLLLAAIVRRGSQLAWEVAKVFDFKLAIFPKLAEVKLRSKKFEARRKNHSTRKAFVAFAMAFLEVGSPRLLRGIVQRKEMFSGVLRGLGNDDEETVVYVLSTLRGKVLVPESSVPPGLRSVLFGSVTLEQLVSISERDDFGSAAEIAYVLLIRVCTDPENGLMPDLGRQPSPLRGNPKRLLDLMKKLKATNVQYHMDLLLAITKGQPLLGSSYLDEFPYNLDDISSPNWYFAVSLAAKVVSCVGEGVGLSFVGSREPPAFESPDVQNIIKCISPRPFTRLIINKGLLHSDAIVKHGTLKLVLETLTLLESLISAIDSCIKFNAQMAQKWAILKQNIQNEVRILLPEPQVLLSLLSSLNCHYKNLNSSLKRAAESELQTLGPMDGRKKFKTCAGNEDMDILVGGVNSFSDDALSMDNERVDNPCNGDQSNHGADFVNYIGEIWGLSQCSTVDISLDDGDTYFYSKLLETLKIYHRIVPNVLEGSFDFFKVLPSDPLSLPTILQQSLLSLLAEHVGLPSQYETSVKAQPQMYKHLQPFISLLMYSPIRSVRDQAYILAQAAILSTGAFDKNPREISAWFLFIPGFRGDNSYVGENGVAIFRQLSSDIVSFLCDAVSTIGNNLFKYMETLCCYMESKVGKDLSPGLSPFIICVLEKCLKLVSSKSRSRSIPAKALISLYVSSTIKYVLEIQADAGPLSSLVARQLAEILEGPNSVIGVSELAGYPCEWRPLKNLLDFSRSIMHQPNNGISSEAAMDSNSFTHTLRDIKRVVGSEDSSGLIGVTIGFSFALVCAAPSEILQDFSLVISISNKLYGFPFSVLASILFLNSCFLQNLFTALRPGILTGEDRKQGMMSEVDLDSTEDAAAAFHCFLKTAPFHLLLPAIVNGDIFHPLGQSQLQEYLRAKLSEMSPDYSILSLCNILFWINQAQSSNRAKPYDESDEFCETCFLLAEHLLKNILVKGQDTVCSEDVHTALSMLHALEVAEIIFNHPVVIESLERPSSGGKHYTDSVFGKSIEVFLDVAKQGLCKMDYHLLSLLRTAYELIYPFCSQISQSESSCTNEQVTKLFKVLIQKLFLVFKKKFDECIKSKDFNPLVRVYYALHIFIHFISPSELLLLVNWMFSRIEFRDHASNLSFRESSLTISLHISSWVFEVLSRNAGCWERMLHRSFLETKENVCDVLLLQRTFLKVFEIASHVELDIANLCLLRAVKVVKMQKFMGNSSLPSLMVLSRVVATALVDVLFHCRQQQTKTKSMSLFLIAEVSPLHLYIFGQLFAEMLSRSLLADSSLMQENYARLLSEDDIIMLFPTLFSYLNLAPVKFDFDENFKSLFSYYQKIIIDGLSSWNDFVSKDIFEVEFDEDLSSSTEELSGLVSSSVLGMTIHTVQQFLGLGGDFAKLETRLSLFDSVCLCAGNNLLDCDLGQSQLISLKGSLNLINRVVAKIEFCKVMLFPENNHSQSQLKDGGTKVIISEGTSDRENMSRVQFMKMLIRSWISIVKKFPAEIDKSRQTEVKRLFCFRYLEFFIMKNILDLTMQMCDYLIKLDSLTFIEKLVKSALLHRFEVPETLRMLRMLLTYLSGSKLLCTSALKLLLAHSQFAQKIHFAGKSVDSTQFGLVFTPMQSILRSFFIPSANPVTLDRKNNLQEPEIPIKQLELVKLLRVLFHAKAERGKDNSGENTGINLRELVLLLLSSYGATLSEVDIEIYNLMIEIELHDTSSSGSIGEMDYLWGIAALKVKKCREEEGLSSDKINDPESFEVRRNTFRENIPVDPKLCAQTVLNFPYNRILGLDLSSKIEKGINTNEHEVHPPNVDNMPIYDPVFILRFSIHCLSMSYVEPIEFAALGLLAIAFVSISSPDEGMRKLGYVVLEEFKAAIKRGQKRKDVTRLRLLLTYLENNIEEPWQRISSITAVFMAEASFVLLDPSHDNYSTISKNLMRSPNENLKIKSLFEKLFWSSSASFKTDRLWILRLLYAGLNTDDDAQIYIRNSIFESLLSFYTSPLSCNESKGLIVQIVKKSVKLCKMARFLVESCSLILWLSSAITYLHECEHKDKRNFTLTHFPVILEIVNDVISSRSIVEWLIEYALGQLSELSSHLFRFLVCEVELIKDQSMVVNSILQILVLTRKISQRRELSQPHFTFSLEGLFCLHEAADACCGRKYTSSAVLGLKAILMSSPPPTISNTDQQKLLNFLNWAVSTATQSKSRNVPQSDYELMTCSEKKEPKDFLVTKLLHWLTASVIRGGLSCQSSNFNSHKLLEKSGMNTLQSLLEWGEKGFRENKTNFGCEEILAAAIFYLQQLVGVSRELLPSVVSALCLLLLPGRSTDMESDFGREISLPSLCLKIRCPPEANPAWRWSFDKPWQDKSSEDDDPENMDEICACQRLLVVVSHILEKKLQFLSFTSTEKSHVFEWERSFV